MSPAAHTDKSAPATASEIRSIVGSLEDSIIAAILRTGASCADVLHAYEWEQEDEYIGAGPENPEGRVKLVYDILRGDREMGIGG